MTTQITPDFINHVLRGAAELIEQPGQWTQGTEARGADDSQRHFDSVLAVRWCMIGGIRRVAGQLIADQGTPKGRPVGFKLVARSHAASAATDAAVERVADYVHDALRPRRPGTRAWTNDHVVEWANDTHSLTAADAGAILRKAADWTPK